MKQLEAAARNLTDRDAARQAEGTSRDVLSVLQRSVVPAADSPLSADARVREWTARGARALALLHGVEVVGLISVATDLDPLA